jgi:hypothetical protein
MKSIIREFVQPAGSELAYRFRIGKSVATALAGFIAGVAGTIFYFWYVLKHTLPPLCQ